MRAFFRASPSPGRPAVTLSTANTTIAAVGQAHAARRDLARSRRRHGEVGLRRFAIRQRRAARHVRHRRRRQAVFGGDGVERLAGLELGDHAVGDRLRGLLRALDADRRDDLVAHLRRRQLARGRVLRDAQHDDVVGADFDHVADQAVLDRRLGERGALHRTDCRRCRDRRHAGTGRASAPSRPQPSRPDRARSDSC